ncbi:MAG TPA: hypothetical protein VH120_04435 [Gemmataceae bacterium]|nr:hypothetical protein [Gemmataceae bacterium]
MDQCAADQIALAKDFLRSAILFRNWKDARRALEALEEVEQQPVRRLRFGEPPGRCEFCPVDGGPCCVCNSRLN